jgi:peptidoglycan/xylan/chitin deacetylase (PgdA/CDA1 family)
LTALTGNGGNSRVDVIGSCNVDVRRVIGLLGLTGLVGALPLFLCSPPFRPPAAHGAKAITVASVSEALVAPGEIRALPDVTADVPVVPQQNPDCLVLRCVALTFDDGPGPYTDTLLKTLADADVRATFFLIGQSAQAYPDQVRAEFAQGEEIGNHSWTHPQLTHLGDDEVANQQARTAAEIERIDGQAPTLFRPPYGDVNARVSGILGAHGSPVVLWSVDTLDWLYRNPASVYRRAMSAVQPGSIILMHDIHPTTVQAVPRIIAELRSRGYTLVTVSQLFGGSMKPGVDYFGRERDWSEAQRAEPTDSPTPSATPSIEAGDD